ncbi:MAG TPA: NrfD/PsrC family molybdoenzyme membrane anchor subunit [Rhodocyclaceae bacterium]|nr:NrfD/PsrC family molybdoenzyme membrane anchor subunit [Rhodocyclaceae bacterium]
MNTTVEIFGYAREPGWLPSAVQYFFLIGVSIGAFFLSLPGLVWGRAEWRGVSRRALLAALVCGLTAPVALLADLHQPGRFLNFYLHPNFGSWMAWGSFFIPIYLFGLLLYAWLCLRPRLAVLAGEGGPLAPIYRTLAYGGYRNAGAIRAAALVAGVGALTVLLYTGMEMMVIGARSLWHTPVLPLLYAVTAVTGGLGMTGLFEAANGRSAAAPVLNRWLERCQWLTLALLGVWLVLGFTGLSTAAAEALAAMNGSLGWLASFAWLIASILAILWAARRPGSLLLLALFALQLAWTVRWIVFMGGQALAKIGAATYAYSVSLTPDSLLGILGTAGLCLVLYIVLTSLVPWDDSAEA